MDLYSHCVPHLTLLHHNTHSTIVKYGVCRYTEESADSKSAIIQASYMTSNACDLADPTLMSSLCSRLVCYCNILWYCGKKLKSEQVPVFHLCLNCTMFSSVYVMCVVSISMFVKPLVYHNSPIRGLHCVPKIESQFHWAKNLPVSAVHAPGKGTTQGCTCCYRSAKFGVRSGILAVTR